MIHVLSPGLFWIVLLCSAAVLAVWLDARFPQLQATSVGRLILHAATSLFVLVFLVPALARPVVQLQTLLAIEAAAVGIVLPGFTYALLSCVWLVRLGQRSLTGDLR